MAFFTSDRSPGFLGFSLRLILVLCIPLIVVGWLLYAATQHEAAIQARNMRWLGQMANQIQNHIRNYDRIVSRVKSSGERTYGIVPNLDPAPADECTDRWRHLSVVDDIQGAKLRFHRKGECAYSNLQDLIQTSLRAGVFESIILAQRDGTVLYQSDPEKIRLTNVEFLFQKGSQERSLLNLAPAAAPPSATPPVPEPPGKNAPTSTMHLTRQVGDQEYDVFIQPLKLVLSGEANGAEHQGDWMLIGLHKEGVPWKSSSARGFTFLFPLVVLLALAVWPLPRLWHSQPLEPLRRRQLTQVLLCTVGVLLIMVVFGLYLSMRNLAKARTDDRLQVFAEKVGRNLNHEISLALRQIYALDAIVKAQPEPQEVLDSLFTKLQPKVQPKDVFSHFEHADWMDAQGNKKVRWTPKPTPARPISVADRPYFLDALAGRTVTLNGLPQYPFTIQQVLSRTTGKMSTTIAIPSANAKREDRFQYPVASISKVLAAVVNPVLPGDFGFAIVEPDGGVIFHSEPSRIRVENFFEECADAPELPAVVTRRVRAFVDCDYSGEPHRMLATPMLGMEQVPWTLVVYRSMIPVEIIRTQAFIGAATLFVCFVLASALMLVVFFLVLGRYRRRFAPRSTFDLAWWTQRSLGYPAVAVAGLLLTITFWRSLDRLNGPILFYASLAATVLFLVLTATGLRSRSLHRGTGPLVIWVTGNALLLGGYALVLRDPAMAAVIPLGLAGAGFYFRQNARRWVPTAWVAWTAELALCAIIAPAFTAGKLAYEYEAGLYVRELQWDLFQEAEGEHTRLVEEIKELPGVQACPLIQERILAGLGLGRDTGACPAVYFYGEPGFSTLLWQGATLSPASASEGSCPAPAEKMPVPPCVDEVRRAKIWPPGRRPPRHSPWRAALNAFPISVLALSEAPISARSKGLYMRLQQLEPAGQLWTWRTFGADDQLSGEEPVLWLFMGQKAAARSSLPTFIPWDMFTLERWTQPIYAADLWMAFEFWAGLCIVICALLWWVTKLRNRVLLMHLPGSRALPVLNVREDASVTRLFLQIPGDYPHLALPEFLEGRTVIDCSSHESLPAQLPAGALLFTHLDHNFGDEASRLARLALLEEALRNLKRPVAVVSSVDPFPYLRGGGAGPLSQPATTGELARWSRALSYFTARRLKAGPGEPLPDLNALWDSCSHDEKIVLVNLRDHRMINPMASDIARALIDRGIIRRTPSLRFDFVSTAFQRFVTAVESQPEAATLMVPKPKRILSPVAIGLILFGVVMFFSQEETTSRLLGFLTTITGGFEALRRQLSAFSGGGKDSSPKG